MISAAREDFRWPQLSALWEQPVESLFSVNLGNGIQQLALMDDAGKRKVCTV